MPMTERDIDGQYTYGWRFGLGFGAAASVWLIIWGVIGLAVTNAVFKQSVRQLQAITKTLPSRPIQPGRPAPRVVEVAPKSKEDCFATTGGVINEEFKQCISGYTTTVQD